MRAFLFVEQLVPIFFVASSVLLGVGLAAMSCVREPAAKQRVGELCVAAVLFWLLLAVSPIREHVSLSSWLDTTAAHDTNVAAANLPRAAADQEDNVPSSQLEEVISSAAASNNSATPSPAGVSHVDVQSVNAAVADLMPMTENVQEALGSDDASRSQIGWRGWLAVSYLNGVALFTAWLLIGRMLLSRLLGHCEAPPEWLTQEYVTLCGLRAARILLSRDGVPFSCGILRPTIVVPKQLCDPTSAPALRDVLRHEQGHIERWDAVGHALLNSALPLLYFHPLYWLIRARTMFNREIIADSWATQRTDRRQYVENLTQLVRQGPGGFFRPVGVLGMSRFRSSFCRRMNRLMHHSKPLATRNSRYWTTAATTLAVLFSVSGWLAVDVPSWAESERGDVSRERIDSKTSSPGEGDSSDAEDTGELQAIGKPIVCYLVAKTRTVYASVDGVLEQVAKRGQQVAQGDLVASFAKDQANIALALAERELEVHRTRIQSDAEVKYAQAVVSAAKNRLGTALRVTKNPSADAEVSKMRSELAAAEAALKKAISTRKVSELQSRGYELAVEQAQQLLHRHKMVAPMDGVVAKRLRSEGEYVERGEPICQIQQMDRLTVEAHVPLERFRPGYKRVMIHFERSGKSIQLPGEIESVGSEVQPDRTIALATSLENEKTEFGEWALLPGMSGRLYFMVKSTAGPQNRGAASPANSAATPPNERSGPTVARDLSLPGPKIDPYDRVLSVPSDVAVDVVRDKNVESDRPAAIVSSPKDADALKQLVDSLSLTRDHIKARHDAGTTGGEFYLLAQIQTDLTLAQGQLAEALGKPRQAIEFYKAAVDHANAGVTASEAAYDSGMMTLDVLVKAFKKRAEAKTQLRRMEITLRKTPRSLPVETPPEAQPAATN